MKMTKFGLLLCVVYCFVELCHLTLGHPINLQRHFDGHPATGTILRHKRQIVDFKALPEKKWTLPIKYHIIIGDKRQKQMIHRAIQAWENVTCVKFQEVPGYLSNISFINGFWCASPVGSSKKYGSILLSSDCISVGAVMHEIGHTLGLYHEMQRLDRDKYVKLEAPLNMDKNASLHDRNYGYPDNKTEVDGVPFDLGSIMEYSADASLYEENEYLSWFHLLPKKHRNIFVMGQSVEIGFYDAKIINLEYCADPNRKKLSCKYDGYPDPLAPGKCRCLPEWSGQYCQYTSSSSRGCSPKNGHHSHTHSDVGKEFSLYTPNYLSNQNWSFNSGDQCFWYIQGPHRYQIAWWFDTDHDNSRTGVYLGMYMEKISCQAWLEIRKPSETRGRRICGMFDSKNHLTNGTRPILSHSHNLHISFRSFSAFDETLPALMRRGFYLKYKFVSKQLKYKTSIPLKDEVKYVVNSWKRLDPRNI